MSKSSKDIKDIVTQVAAQLAATAVKTQTALSSMTSSDHDTLTSLVVAVQNIDAKFTEKFADIKADIKNLNDGTSLTISKYEDRIAKLEQRQWLWAGGLMVLVFLSPLIFNWVSKIIYK